MKHSANHSFFYSNILCLVNNQELVFYDIDNKSVINETELSHNSNITSCSIGSTNLVISYLDKQEVEVFDLTRLLSNNIISSYIINTHTSNNQTYVTVTKLINNNNDIIFVFSNNNIKRYSLRTKEFVSLSNYNSTKLASAFKTPNKDSIHEANFTDVPKNLITWYNKILGIIQINEDLLLAYTDYNIIPIMLNKEIPEVAVVKRDLENRNQAKSSGFYLREYHNSLLNEINSEYSNSNSHSSVNKKNKVSLDIKELSKETNENMNFAIITKFISNVFVEYTNNKLFVVEIDWENILKTMIDPIVKQRYKK